jgi:hypothetical protein
MKKTSGLNRIMCTISSVKGRIKNKRRKIITNTHPQATKTQQLKTTKKNYSGNCAPY